MDSNPYSISAPHNSSHSHGHNIRSEKIIEHESWVKKNTDGSPRADLFEVWKDIPLREAYHDLFDKSLEEYNSKQKRSDRKIDDYYDHIKKSKDKNLSYEFIFTIGNMEHHPDPEVSKQIYHEFIDSWPMRNPNLILTGVYYHGDEDGAPHIHVDYIPVAHDCKRGLKTQTSQNQAFYQMGFSGSHLAEQLFERERETLKSLAENRGLECTLDYMDEKRKQMPTTEYKEMMQEGDFEKSKMLTLAEADAELIISDAKEQANEILAQAEAEADAIVSTAQSQEDKILAQADADLELYESARRKEIDDQCYTVSTEISSLAAEIAEAAKTTSEPITPIKTGHGRVTISEDQLEQVNTIIKNHEISRNLSRATQNTPNHLIVNVRKEVNEENNREIKNLRETISAYSDVTGLSPRLVHIYNDPMFRKLRETIRTGIKQIIEQFDSRGHLKNRENENQHRDRGISR